MDNLEKAKDALGSFLVFLVPGAMSIWLIDNRITALTGLAIDKTAILSNAVALLLLSVGMGLILYAYWGVLFRLVSLILRFKPLNPKDVESIDGGSLEKMKLTYDQDFRLYQTYGSLTVLFLISAASSFVDGDTVRALIFITTSIVCTLSSVFCYLVFMRRMRKFVQPSVILEE